ncbi:hypothetical protein PMAYCL1PPCAC_28248 [Pristionchus mayeri]|uniref:C2H2-type domain-containing protein n=1 Tax=Pristionchus mayeri TaxID=1317129 RepID=A0AAN5D7A5_9BILA|nr:hypothetical protein PMAYCL1PPCAC_28248 [Pristionchus mayeri]
MELLFPCVECNDAFSTSIERLIHRFSRHPHYFTAGGGNCRICGQNVVDLFENVDHLVNSHPAEFIHLSSEAQRLNAQIGVAQSAVYWLQETCQPPGEQSKLSFTPRDVVSRMRLRAEALCRAQNGGQEQSSDSSNPAGISYGSHEPAMYQCEPSTSAATSSLSRKRPIDTPNTYGLPKTSKNEPCLRESPPSDCMDHSAAIATSSALLHQAEQPQMKDMNNGRLSLLLSMLITFGSPLIPRTRPRVLAEAERIAVNVFRLSFRLPDYDERVSHAVRRAAASVQKVISSEEKITLSLPLPDEEEMKAIELATALQLFYPDPSYPSPSSEALTVYKLSRSLEFLLATRDEELAEDIDGLLQVLQQHLQQSGVRDIVQQAIHAAEMHCQVMELRSRQRYRVQPCVNPPQQEFAPAEPSEAGAFVEDVKETVKAEEKWQEELAPAVPTEKVQQREATPVLFEDTLEDVKDTIKSEPLLSPSTRCESPFFISPTKEDLATSPCPISITPFVSNAVAEEMYEEDKGLWRASRYPRSCKYGCILNVSHTAMITHYRKFHYDVYYLAVHRCWENEQRRWLAVRFGDEKGGKQHTRVCQCCGLNCCFIDRVDLAMHLKEEHPEYLTDLRTEFLDLFDGEIKRDPIVRILLEHVD